MAAGVARRYKPEKDGYVFGSARSCDTFHTLVSKQQWIHASGICKSQIRRFEALFGLFIVNALLINNAFGRIGEVYRK